MRRVCAAALLVVGVLVAAGCRPAGGGSADGDRQQAPRREALGRAIGTEGSITPSPAGAAAGGSTATGGPASPTEAPGGGLDDGLAADDAAASRWVESTLAGMSLEARIGQLLMGYVFGTSAGDRAPRAVAGNRLVAHADTAADAVRSLGLGGVTLFDAGGTGPGALPDNIVGPAQVRGLTAGLQSASAIPLLVAADQEQGPVLRIRDGVTLLPDQMAQGAGGLVDDARDAARVTGADLRGLGVNVDFAPDADVNTNPANPVIGERSFGDDPAAVARFTAAAVRGFSSAGVAAAAKHFPGHGSTSVDSHLDLPLVTASRERLAAVDLAPFRSAIAAGVPMVMVGHLLVPALDAATPTSLSTATVTTLLRHELGFDGVVVTDALNMAAITKRYSPGEAAVRAVLAGVDLLLMPPDLVAARDGLLGAVRSGRVPAGRVDESVRRVLRLKWRLAHASPRPAADGAAVAARIASRSVTLLARNCGALPLRAGSTATVVGTSTAAARLRAALAARGIAAPANGGRAAATVTVAGDGSAARAAPGSIVVSTGAPYHAPPAPAAWLATYSADPASITALAAVLTGAIPPSGHLPVATTSPAGRPLARGYGMSASAAC
ncbi:putative Beta-N-acetylglucosaminidase [Frankia canadensis]|uniref:beta-N-acetylhexosaminidase n=1 Tax=Frankia canadensis TaxID=1836972 RepID=A0A2I2KR89_9ACTN|nr:glycoside hydrolase family 3 N-terminal domain-containing protein [Frankia canadensis]SNQ48156.1 putative Beta-N-acetylglucosaminidase [Frankia canadensis]SOU55446.1 putative Beta-N-acetylglucosaminidase [Frankia canadensis]